MNFLAHLDIADHCHSSKLGNLLGDFVKGDPQPHYSVAVANGIRLHRFVDSYTDHHPLVKEAKHFFTNTTRRFAPIALDMFWDHCLARHWQAFHQETLNAFCTRAEQETEREQATESEPAHASLPERYLTVSGFMWQDRWLESYQTMSNIEKALQRMSTRSPRMAPLAHSFADLERHYDVLERLFFQLYPDVLTASQNALVLIPSRA